VPYKFVTNTTTDKRAGIAGRLCRSGIPCEEGDIISPAICAALYLQQNKLGGWVRVLVSGAVGATGVGLGRDATG
jgi:ribonucleotide monophosphatase NagD (HAD superfamily)